MWRITQYIPRFTCARGSCVAQQTIRDEEQFGTIAVLKNHHRRFHCNFNEKEKRRNNKEKQEEPGADREWFRQHVGQQYFTCDVFGLGSAVVLGLQFGHLCNLFMQKRDIHCVNTPWTQQEQFQLVEAISKLQNQGLLTRRILPASTPTPSSSSVATTSSTTRDKKVHFEFDTWSSEEEESLPVSKTAKRSLVHDFIFPFGEASSPASDLSEDSWSSLSSAFSTASSLTSTTSEPPQPSTSKAAPGPPTSSANVSSAPFPEFTEAWTNLTLQYIGIHGNERGMQLAASGDLVGAFQSWKQAADGTGYTKARFNTALCYETGQGVTKDKRKAVEYYSLAAGLATTTTTTTSTECAHAGAAYNLAIMYINHPKLMSVQGSKTLEPQFLLERAAESGMVEAMRALGQTMLEDEDSSDEVQTQGMQWLHKAALEHEDAESQYYLGHCYWQGMSCLPQDLDAALEYFEMARKNGYTEAEEHIITLREQVHKQRFESLLESLHRNEGPGPPPLKVSHSVPTLSQSLKHHLLEFNLSEWDSGFSSPTENSTELWENAIGITENSTDVKKPQTDVKFLLGDDTKEKKKVAFQIGEVPSQKEKKPDTFGLAFGSFGNIPLKTEKPGKVAKM